MTRYRTEDVGYATLREALNSRNAEELKKLIQLFGGKKPTRKADCVTAIVRKLSGEKALKSFWNKLDTLSQAAVAEVAHASGDQLDIDSFVAKYGKVPRKYYDDNRDRLKNVPWTLLDVVFTWNSMPRDLKEQFRAFVPKPAEPSVKTLDILPPTLQSKLCSWRVRAGQKPQENPLAVCETEAASLLDLAAVLRLIDAGKLGVSVTTRRPTLASVKAVAAVLRDGDFVEGKKAEDFIRAFALPLLVQAAGLARLSGARLKLSKAGREALNQPAHEIIKLCWEKWKYKGLVDEFNRIEEIKGQKRKGRGGLTDVTLRRMAVGEVLRSCPVGEWIDIDEFFRYFQATGTMLEVVEDIWRLYISHAEYGCLAYDDCCKWSMIQGRYVMALIWEYLATLGLVDIAHIPGEYARDDFWDHWAADEMDSLSRYDGLKFLRITDLGAYCLGITNEYVQTQKIVRSSITVLPNYDVVIVDPSTFSSADALFLDRIAVKNSEHLWNIDKQRMLDALEKGIQGEEIFDFLESLSQVPLPDNVRHFIDETIKRASRVSWEGTAELFCTEDEATALLIAHNKTAKKFCYLAGANRLVVPSRHVTAFRKVLRQLGFVAPPGKTIK
jgi:hypothetical protein